MVMFVLISSVAWGQTSGFIQIQSDSYDVWSGLTLDTNLNYKLNERLSLSAYFLVAGDWAQAYAGPTWRSNDHMELTLSIGGAQGSKGLEPRYAVVLAVNDNGVLFFGTLELDTASFCGYYDGLWYDLNLDFKLNDWFVLGVKDRRSVGIGPVARLRLPKVEFWLSWMPISAENHHWQPNMVTFGVLTSF